MEEEEEWDMKDEISIIERRTGSIKSSGVDINYRRCRRQFPIARAIEVRYSGRVQDFARGASSPNVFPFTSSHSSLFPDWSRSSHVRLLLISISISTANKLSA